jgi:hypothetical protein
MRVNKQPIDLFRKFGVRLKPFHLTSTEAMMDFTNIAKTLSANQDEEEEEVWLELQFYRDQKHLEDASWRRWKMIKLGLNFSESLCI